MRNHAIANVAAIVAANVAVTTAIDRVAAAAANSMNMIGDGLTDGVMLVPAGNANRRTGVIMVGGTPDNIVVHETANTNPGADAVMHGHFLAGGGGSNTVGFHAGVDSKRTIQYLPWNEKCYAAGDGANGTGNADSVNIELCVNRDGDYWAAVSRLAVLVARLRKKFNIPGSKIKQHNYYSSYGKDCPHFLRTGNNWARFLTMVSEEFAKLDGGPIVIDRFFPETGIALDKAFVPFFDAHGGLQIFGYPIRPAITITSPAGVELLVQYTERSRFELHPNTPPTEAVKLGLVGSELLDCKK